MVKYRDYKKISNENYHEDIIEELSKSTPPNTMKMNFESFLLLVENLRKACPKRSKICERNQISFYE